MPKKQSTEVIAIDGPCSDVAISGDGAWIGAIAGGQAVLARAASLEKLSLTLPAVDGIENLRAVAVAFVGDQLAVVWDAPGADRFGVVLHDHDGKVVAKTGPLAMNETGARAAASRDGSQFAVSVPGKRTYRWTAAELRAGSPGTPIAYGGSGSAAPIAFSDTGELLVAVYEATGERCSDVVCVPPSGEARVVSTDADRSTKLAASEGLWLGIGGPMNRECTLSSSAGARVASFEETFTAATLVNGRVVGAASPAASIKKFQGWKRLADDADRKAGVLAVADARGAFLHTLPLQLGRGDQVRSIAVHPESYVAIGLDAGIRICRWSDVAS